MRYSNLWLAATHLNSEGSIAAFDAVYRFTDPDGRVHRNTRLAATIWQLRHDYGWDITTTQPPGQLAEYRLVKAGTMPDGPFDRKPRTKPVTPPTPKPPKAEPPKPWKCVDCVTGRAERATELLGGYGTAMCESCGKRTTHRWDPR